MVPELVLCLTSGVSVSVLANSFTRDRKSVV